MSNCASLDVSAPVLKAVTCWIGHHCRACWPARQLVPPHPADRCDGCCLVRRKAWPSA